MNFIDRQDVRATIVGKFLSSKYSFAVYIGKLDTVDFEIGKLNSIFQIAFTNIRATANYTSVKTSYRTQIQQRLKSLKLSINVTVKCCICCMCEYS